MMAPPPPPLLTRRRCLVGALAVGTCAFGWAAGAAGSAGTTVVYPLHLGNYDARYDYDWRVLRTALEKTVAAYGPFNMKQYGEPMSPQRVVQELSLPHGRVNVMARAAAPELERDFLTVRIPIDKGLLGYRVLLVRKTDLPRFAQVRTLQDLRKLRAGMGKGWADVAILAGAGLPVVEGSAHENLYAMLMANRFDYFARGVDEAQWEMQEYGRQFPGMVIEPTLLLRYPLPRYLFLRRDAQGEQLARRLKAGLETMVQDGSLNALFRLYKGPIIEPLQLERRRLIVVPNPGLPQAPLNRPELWYTPKP